MTFDDVKSFVSNRINNAPDPPQEYIPLFKDNASKHGWFSWQVLAGIAFFESCFKPNTPNNRYKCGGMMQIMDGNMSAHSNRKYNDADKFDAAKSVEVAANMLTYLKNNYFSGANEFEQLFLCLSAYNSGAGRCIPGLWRKNGHDLLKAFNDCTNLENKSYAPTILAYIQKIGGGTFGSFGSINNNFNNSNITSNSLSRPYPWEYDDDIKRDKNNKLYCNTNLISGILRFKLMISNNISLNNTNIIGNNGGGAIVSGGRVNNALNLGISGASNSNEYHLVLWRYNQCPSKGGHDAYEGVIYEYNTNNVLTYTIEDVSDIKGNAATWHNGKDIDTTVNPGGGTWPSAPNSPYHWGCSMYCANLAQGRGGFGKAAKQPYTMLRAGYFGCLFHPGADVTWSEGCVLCGEQAHNGRRNVVASEYTMERISTSTNKDVLWWRNFYDHVVPAICDGKRVILHVRTNLSSIQTTPATFTSPTPLGNNTDNISSNQNLVSIRQSLTNANLMQYVIINPLYATTNNFGGRVFPGYKAGQNDLYLGKQTMNKLINAVEYLKNRYPNNKLMIWDAYRPWKAADAFADIAPQYVGKYIARKKKIGEHSTSKHCQGVAIDLTLCNSSGKPLPMTSASLSCPWAQRTGGFDEFSDVSKVNVNHPNQKILRDIMMNGGKLNDYVNEFWHFQNNGLSECDGSTNYD